MGAPVAWGVQFAVGYWLSQAECSTAGQSWGISLDAWAVILTAAMLAAGAGAVATAIWIFRATKDSDADTGPPTGRVYFLACVGLAVAPLFLCLIAMTGAGTIALACHQS